MGEAIWILEDRTRQHDENIHYREEQQLCHQQTRDGTHGHHPAPACLQGPPSW